MKKALITGITGMDGSHLADFLLKKGYEVYGLERRSSTKNRVNIKHIENKINLIEGDLTDQMSLARCLKAVQPDEIYNLAAQSFVGESWNTPEQTSNVNGLGTLRMLEAIREFSADNSLLYEKSVRFYQASTSEMFGKVQETPQTENTPFYPRSPYGVSKLYAHWITKNYRESYGMFACCGILFNHESERRGIEFVTRKITDGIARIHLGLQDHISLGNLDAKRDWGYSPDYVEAMWLMLQQDTPDDYVISTGKTYSIKEFLNYAFNHIGVTDWEKYIKQDPRYMRLAEVDLLCGDSTKAYEKLGWEPKTDLVTMIGKMVDNDIKLIKKELG